MFFNSIDLITESATTLTTKPVDQKYDDGSRGVKVIFYDNGVEIGEASAADYNGKRNSFLHGVEVKKELRGKGYGTEILKYMIKKYNVKTLYVKKTNRAVNLYRRFGFKEIDSFNDGNMLVMQR